METQPTSDSLRLIANRLGVEPPTKVDDGVDWALPIIAELRVNGLNTLIKLDGERLSDPATVVLSGPLLEGNFVRRDGPTLGETLASALDELAQRGWG